MPLALTPMETRPQMLNPSDRGFLINLPKAKWSNNACTEAIKLMRNFTQMYYESKCPESKEEEQEPDDPNLAELEELELEDSPDTLGKEDRSGIQFAIREMAYPNVGFVACNLADPSDFAHFVLSKLGAKNDYKKTKLPFRIVPVQRICEAKAKAVEQSLIPLLENSLAKDEFPYRFSIIYRSHAGGENLSRFEAKSVVRNCIWALNPNCVQCIKYQDFAIVVDIFDPLFMVGVAKDFQKLASYNTGIIRNGIKSDLGTDSEDDISDDPTLSEEEEKKRKLRIKRKRRAEKAGLAQPEGDIKKSVEHQDEKEDNDVEDEDESNHKADDVIAALNGDEDDFDDA